MSGGKSDLGNLKNWKDVSMQGRGLYSKGSYILGSSRHFPNSIVLRYIRSAGAGPGNKTIQKHAGRYKDLIYEEWRRVFSSFVKE